MHAVRDVARKLSEQHPQLKLTVQLEGSVLVLLGEKEQPVPMPWEGPPHVDCIRALRHSSRGASSRLPGAVEVSIAAGNTTTNVAMLLQCLCNHDRSLAGRPHNSCLTVHPHGVARRNSLM